MIATTTLNKIRAEHPCEDGWKKLLAHLGKTKADDEVVTLQTVLESNGIDDALWTLRASDAPEATMRAYACWAALSVSHLWDMPVIVREYLETQDESKRAAARDAARAAGAAAGAARAAWAARDAAWAAAGAARAAWAAAGAAQKQQFIGIFCTEEGEGLKRSSPRNQSANVYALNVSILGDSRIPGAIKTNQRAPSLQSWSRANEHSR